jgi:FixJ family two-component response regulator
MLKILEQKIIGLYPSINLSLYRSSKEFIEKRLHSPPEIIILDFNMPDLNGVEVIELFSKTDYSGSVLLLSASLKERVFETKFKFDLTQISKPITDLDLDNYIRNRLK